MAEQGPDYAEAVRVAGRFADAYALAAPAPELEPIERETLRSMLTPYIERSLVVGESPTARVETPIRAWESLMKRRKPGPVTFDYHVASGRVRAL